MSSLSVVHYFPCAGVMTLTANLSPSVPASQPGPFSPLKPEVIGEGIDLVIIRELVGGLYFGKKESGINEAGRRYVHEMLEYDEDQIRRVLEVAFELASKRKKVLHNVHKSNVLKSSVLWNEVLNEVRPNYPEVAVEHVLVDAAATYLCLNPTRFDVMVMENMFGDILSDQGGGILGSLGLMPSACVGPQKSYYEPSHGSAPDIAGQGIANPYSMLGSVAMMLEMSFNMAEEARNLWQAMQAVFVAGYTTPDLARRGERERKSAPPSSATGSLPNSRECQQAKVRWTRYSGFARGPESSAPFWYMTMLSMRRAALTPANT